VTILPAIDILNGECVRLTRGRYDQRQLYSTDPVEVARSFERAGARWIHLVDLDAARLSADAGRGPESPNRRVIRRIAGAVSCRLEVGGGIRRLEDVQELLAAGAARLVLGTVLVRRPEQAADWCRLYPGLLWAGIDAEAGAVKISGWEQRSSLQDVELAAGAAQMSLGGIVYTSIGRDGTLEGPDIESTNRIAAASGLPVILSGGIGCAADVERVEREGHRGVQGIVIGKAIYEGRVKLGELLSSGKSDC
jgi:phosphoribosylformimino-5-aminoimidazole carboxamide ribotide isomerase